MAHHHGTKLLVQIIHKQLLMASYSYSLGQSAHSFATAAKLLGMDCTLFHRLIRTFTRQHICMSLASTHVTSRGLMTLLSLMCT